MSAPVLAGYANEAYTDFALPANRQHQQQAIAAVRRELGRDYDNWIAGRPARSGQWLDSVNPSLPSERIGRHAKASAAQAAEAVADAYDFFPEWANTPVEERIAVLARAAALLRERKATFNAWMILEAGKSFAEAEADTAEAIDFCEYYAHQMRRFAHPEPIVQLPGERNEMVYLPLGVGVVIPPWNFPLAILAGTAVSALVCGNTVVLKPSSETPIIAAKFVQLLHEAGLPARALQLCVGSGSEVGDALVLHPKTRFVSFTGSREVGLRINELAARPAPGCIWIKRVVAEMGGKDAIVVDEDCDLEAAATGVVQSAFGFQGQKCSACSRAIVHYAVYEPFLALIKAKTEALTLGAADNPANAMGPVISAKARQTIAGYIETGKKEGRLLTGGDVVPSEGYFLTPTVFADVDRGARIFQEEIFGPVLAVTPARSFDHALELANDSDYGLTGAVYTLDPANLEKARRRFHVGNLYLNRKCTGAMVGAHPFGGFNMSGTDSKAGGPDYLLQFLQAQSIAERIL
ncbi:MAG TPA: L-glutamate gamma-semialdehyde dehydrogenase [Bryobacteraceae bacterium]|nr:L-glutamate gamma-semialdehyde dehydrogenase [Bryobacteraceae bacterium]